MDSEGLGRGDDLFYGGGRMGELMRARDWAATPLGPPETWPLTLRSMVRILLTSRYQMWMGWGPELLFFYNDAYTPTLGVKHPSALARPASDVWREIWPDIGPLADHVMQKGEATYSEAMLLLLERSGFPEETYHTFSYSPLFDDAGSVAGLFCVVVEETERVINERRLATLRALASAAASTKAEAELFGAVNAELRANLSDLPFALAYIFDGDGNARLAASSGVEAGHPLAAEFLAAADGTWPIEKLLGFGPAVEVENLSERFGSLPTGDWDRPPRDALLVPIAQQGNERPAGFFIAGINPYRPLDQSYRGFIDLVAGQIGAALANVRAYEEERRRAEALAEIDRAKTIFFTNISHEFRTPLTLMLSPLEELLATPPQSWGDPRPQVEVAHRNAMRLLRLVNSLLDFSRIEAGRVQASYEPTDLAAFSAEIASSFRSAVERAGLQLNVSSQPLGQPVFVDRDMWEKILLNLLSNAFKFTFEGGISVSVRRSPDCSAAEVRVADTGIGIPEDELPRLFERFHRVEGAQGRSFEGSGIGLALVQELVKLHGGRIDAESAPGRGTTFLITLPFGSSHLPKERVRETSSGPASIKAQPFVEEALRWLPDAERIVLPAEGLASISTEAMGSALAPLPGAGKRILLADDNADMRDYVRRLLAEQGFLVQAVEDGEKAVAAARAAAPDLIITDVMMPKLDGFGVLRAVRGEPRLAGIPVVMLSARAGEEAKVEGLNAGADDYLVKPFGARELLARVAANIQLAEVRREAARAVMHSEQRYLMTQERLSRALSTGRVAVYDWNVNSDRLSIQGPLAEVFGVRLEDAIQGLPLQAFLDGIHPDDRDKAAALVQRTVDTGEPFEAEYRTHGGGEIRTVLSRGLIETTPEGERMFSGVLIDLTHEKETETALREQGRTLAILNRAMSAIAGDLDLERIVQTITDAGVELSGAEFGAFFYNVDDDAGERYMLYTLSGAPREAFSKFPLPRKTQVFGPTFDGTAIVRSDDITIDPRYGKNHPRKGMPEGHLPVRSYLAVPVRSRTGEVLGGLFFGHPKPGRFTHRAEELIVALAGPAAVAIDNARLFQQARRELEQRRRAERELEALNATLEQRIAEEVAERVKAEEALRQAQKMEAVGQLTGGVAHDFNNLLTVIIGGLDTIRRSGLDDGRVQRATDMALQGAQRAASLTKRLLAFSRRQPLDPKPLDLNLMVRDMTELLHRTLGETIELEGVLAPRLWTVEVDQNQLESAIINLAVNARDAMPEGGKLTIETANTALDESYSATDAEVIPGQYVMVAVSDTGIGMSKATLARAFEPFFTSKDAGRGTGLGLSQVYGFVKQSGGHVTIYSEEGQGTTVKMYFPRYSGNSQTVRANIEVAAPRGSRDEVVLVVEDNDDVRSYSVMILSELGYRVLEAADAEEALRILENTPRVDLLFTDVVLPGMTGRVLADRALARWPHLRVLYTTGYSRNAIVHHGRLDAGVNLISKPFTFDELAVRVRDILDRLGKSGPGEDGGT
ncbi:ATP-binding protein [Chelativorans sp.]|uniref:ATP-binding protein n=1 Tax=Chelativorans sp. TaxID=2203393 RepID=UPI0028113846|nr:ATP-binding protein [Chelativorans sp.]